MKPRVLRAILPPVWLLDYDWVIGTIINNAAINVYAEFMTA
jgi:hypothetical protein